MLSFNGACIQLLWDPLFAKSAFYINHGAFTDTPNRESVILKGRYDSDRDLSSEERIGLFRV